MDLVFAFLGGMFLTNGVPHFVLGMAGQRHMTMLAKDSSALVNVLWGFGNFLLGAYFVLLSGGALGQVVLFNGFALSFWAGSLFMALNNAWLFSNPNAKFPWFK